MTLQPLNCQNCGATLNIPEEARFVTCLHCGTQLAIKNAEGVRFTAAIDELAGRLDCLSDKHELRLLDLEWAAECETLKLQYENGKSIPTRAQAFLSGLILFVMGIVIMCATPVPAFGALFLLGGVLLGAYIQGKAVAYETAHKRYEDRREELLWKQRRKSPAAS